MIARSLWLLLALVLAFGVPFFAIGTQTGTCVDYPAGAAQQSYCSSEPSLGWPAAILLSLIGLLAAAWAVRRSRPRRD